MFNVFLTQYSGPILGPIARILGIILNMIYEFLDIFHIANAGLSIILFTFIVRALMIPLTIKQQKFSKLSSLMNPELTAIQAKYKGKKDEASLKKQQLETQAVYQKYGASPTSGCLPMLITLPIMFALYRVIYNIPAYVDSIYGLYENIASGIQGISGYSPVMMDFAKEFSIQTSKWDDISKLSTNHVIDILSQFQRGTWQELTSKFPNITEVIQTNSAEIIKLNSFLGGLNIADKPGLTWPGILVPIFAMAFQFIQGKQMETQTPVDPNNPTANTMKTMNTVMPIMSGVFCISLPIGVGLYWVAGSVFQIIQQFFISKYMEKVDVNELIAKNVEKAKKKKAKLGVSPDASLEDLAKKQTKSISETTNVSSKTASYANLKTNNESSNKNSNVSFKKGSIAANANLLNRDKTDKGDK
ncbi:YidC/Oxa1 family membrane protein insertase [Mobilisporobacter senegalensis]|uniref:YidC/Oxa1 family membrane protein insertase n=1 Tax=Mobilisporobacter senegalensis TaxID=1329262 RepID=A0A3N1X5U7_9FIRM|nr:YidC/Oxa1 family membrane protein insertase [Mobilisporobacter senegalensis]ROR22133.1 YidC/Oxa1 family membrane protein insertase [Mobilisporobacter senegalensis]